MAKAKEKTKKISILVVIGVIFYILAFLNLLSLFSVFTKNIKILFNMSWSEDFYNLVENSYEFDKSFNEFLSFQKLFSTIFNSAILFIWGSALIFADKARKKKDLEKQERERREREDLENQEKLKLQESEQEYYFCAYCDSELSLTERQCPHCGATKKIKKTKSELK